MSVTLDTPLQCGPVRLPNRMVFAAHLTNFATDGLPGERHATYYAARAAGGAGLIVTEEHTVHPSDRPYEKLIRGYDERVLPGYRLITQAVHAHGAVVLAQLNHNGAQSTGRYTRRPVWAPSAVADPSFREVPVALTHGRIVELVAGYAEVARRCLEGGFDGVELQCSQASIIRQFLSPTMNRRVDDYGGPVANRTRFLLELVDAVRDAVGPSALVGVRLGCDTLDELDELAEVAKMVAGTGRVDYLSGAVGVAGASQYLITPPMGVPAGYANPVSDTLRRAAGLPVLGIGRFTTAEQAQLALSEEHCDLVGVVRGQISDPDFVAKAAGRSRVCIGSNQGCVGRVGLNHSLGCVQNPQVGREATALPGPAPAAKRVLVVGAGPAGLRAAASAAERGHKVTVCEAGDLVGGQLRWAVRAPGREELGLAVRNLLDDCSRVGVALRTKVRVDASYVTSFGADEVVLATGAVPAPPKWVAPGVCDVVDVLTGRVRPSGSVLVYDELGFHQASSVALLLAERGCQVRMVTPAMVAAQDLGLTLDRERFRRQALACAVAMDTDRVVLDADSGAGRVAVRILHHPTGHVEDAEYDAVVCALPWRPADRLWHELADAAAAGLSVHRVGDCVAPRRMDAAIGEGARLGQAL
jgi:mycofactocin system FadH/OYE family oxidoreductase 2